MEPAKEFYTTLLNKVSNGVYIVDREKHIAFWSRKAEEITGRAASEMLHRGCHDVLQHEDVRGKNLCEEDCPLDRTIREGKAFTRKIYLLHKKGHRIPVEVQTLPVPDSSGRIIGAAEVFRDDSAERAARRRLRRLEKLAMLDPLTKLPNRRFLETSIQSRLGEARRYRFRLGVLMIDIDHFKSINDAHGHAVGDRVLQIVGRTLSSNTRPFDLTGRWGGEEFISLVRVVDKEELNRIADRLRTLIETSEYRRGKKRIRVTASIGAVLASDGRSASALVKAADRFMYRSKERGRNRVTVS